MAPSADDTVPLGQRRHDGVAWAEMCLHPKKELGLKPFFCIGAAGQDQWRPGVNQRYSETVVLMKWRAMVEAG